VFRTLLHKLSNVATAISREIGSFAGFADFAEAHAPPSQVMQMIDAVRHDFLILL
jgi:hypothetical protein